MHVDWHQAFIDLVLGADFRAYTTLDSNLDTDEGKWVCQQLFIDMGRFWAGEGVEYLALYSRDW